MKMCQNGIFGLFSRQNKMKKDQNCDKGSLSYTIFKSGIDTETKSQIICMRDRFFE